MNGINVIELGSNMYNIVLDDGIAGDYSYKFYNISYTEPTYYTDIVLTTGEDTIVNLFADNDGVWLLKLLREDGTETYFYSLMVVLTKLEKCKEYCLKMILCGENICNPRYDCDNCDKLRDQWNIRLSELNMIYYELMNYVKTYSLIVEAKITDDGDLVLMRLKNIVNKINSMAKECVSCKDCK